MKRTLSIGSYETRSSKLADENAECRVEFERSSFKVIYGFQQGVRPT